jgi:TonB-dependent starch-binding outer membrane protein SusC
MLLMLPMSFFAQQTVSGTVTESGTGLPVPGVNILVKGTTNGTTTDFDGNYTLSNVRQNDVLVFSFLGF